MQYALRRDVFAKREIQISLVFNLKTCSHAVKLDQCTRIILCEHPEAEVPTIHMQRYSNAIFSKGTRLTCVYRDNIIAISYLAKRLQLRQPNLSSEKNLLFLPSKEIAIYIDPIPPI